MKQKLLLALLALFTLGGSNLYAQTTDAEYKEALASIASGMKYKVFTTYNGTEEGSTKFYLKTDGYLTDSESDAGIFTFDIANGAVKTAGFKLHFNGTNAFTNGGDSNNNFSGDALKKILPGNQNRDQWEAQVFYKNDNGKYAVRSTNANSTAWGASAFWTVVTDNDNDNLPNATYTMDGPQYVWQLEMQEFEDVTSKYITNPMPVSSLDGWTYSGTKMADWVADYTMDEPNLTGEVYGINAGTIKQTISLPKGFYKLRAVALTRTDYVATLNAGSESMNIATAGTDEANNLTQANTWFSKGNGINDLSFSLKEAQDLDISLVSHNGWDGWMVWRNFQLFSSTPDVSSLKQQYQKALTEAQSVLDNTNEVFSEAKTNLQKVITENTVVETDDAVDMYFAYTDAIANLTTGWQECRVATDNFVKENYKTAIELGEWTTNNAGNMSGQHWDGTSATTYNEQKEGWSSSTAWTTSYTQNVTLPAGAYVFKVAGRHSQYSQLVLKVRNGDVVLGSVNDFPIGDTGKGIDTSGNTNFGEGTFAKNGEGRGWQWRFVPFTLTEETTITISVEGSNPQAKQYQWCSFCNYQVLSGPSIEASKIAYNQAKEAAIAARDNDEYKNVKGEELSALKAAIEAQPEETIEWYDAQTEVLKNATSTFIAAKAGWDNYSNNYPAEKAKADAISEEIANGVEEPKNATEAAEAINTLKVAEYNYVVDNYTTAIDLGDWTQEGGTTFNYGGQHWSGENKGYWEQTSSNYSASTWKISFNQTIELPAGEYIFKVAGRHSSGNVTMSLDVTSGETPLGTVNDFPAGDSGKGIDTNGATNFSAEGTYANNNNGRGWEWRYVPFTLTETTSVKIAVNAESKAQYQWISFCDYTVQAKPNIEASKVVLQQAIDAAEAIVPTDNIGTKAFQYPESKVNSLNDAIQEAKNAKDDENATIESIETAKDVLLAAIETYGNMELNVPEATQAYNLIFNCEGHSATGNALTLIPNPAQAQGLYGLKYLAPANVNLAQAFYFVHTTDNKYKIFAVDTDGNDRYITTQAEGYGTTWYEGIRTITDASKAMEVEIRPNGEGLYLLWNTGANKALGHNGNNNNDLFTNNTANFQFVETTKPSIAINTTAAGWGTTMLPFAAEKPADVKIYSCDATEGSTLTLTEVETLEANKPYIIEGAWNATLTGDAQGTALTYTEGYLTGVYAPTKAPVGSYVLQKQNGTVAFYKVADGENNQPTVGANRAYLQVSSEAKMFSFGGDATGISAIEALLNGDAEIFNVSGMKQNSLQKGMNIIKMNDGTTRKIMVK